jgi:hypothetical protein
MYFTKKMLQLLATPPPIFGWLDFCPHLFQPFSLFVAPLFLQSIPAPHHFAYKLANRSHLSTLLHNVDLPLHQITFPSSLKLFFATGNIEPP